MHSDYSTQTDELPSLDEAPKELPIRTILY